MKTVWKYRLEIEDYNDVYMPLGATVLSVALQAGIICLWVLVDPEASLIRRRFRIAGTGHPIDEEQHEFIGTVLYPWLGLVFHVFEVEPE